MRRVLPRFRLNRRGFRLTIYGWKYNRTWAGFWNFTSAKAVRNQKRAIKQWADEAHEKAQIEWDAMTPEEQAAAWAEDAKRQEWRPEDALDPAEVRWHEAELRKEQDTGGSLG